MFFQPKMFTCPTEKFKPYPCWPCLHSLASDKWKSCYFELYMNKKNIMNRAQLKTKHGFNANWNLRCSLVAVSMEESYMEQRGKAYLDYMRDSNETRKILFRPTHKKRHPVCSSRTPLCPHVRHLWIIALLKRQLSKPKAYRDYMRDSSETCKIYSDPLTKGVCSSRTPLSICLPPLICRPVEATTVQTLIM